MCVCLHVVLSCVQPLAEQRHLCAALELRVFNEPHAIVVPESDTETAWWVVLAGSVRTIDGDSRPALRLGEGQVSVHVCMNVCVCVSVFLVFLVHRRTAASQTLKLTCLCPSDKCVCVCVLLRQSGSRLRLTDAGEPSQP